MKFPAIACSLSSAGLRERRGSLLKDFGSAVTAMEELPDGYSFTLRGDGKLIELAAKLVAQERECCPFLTFQVLAQPNHGPLIARVTGPHGTKEFLKTIFAELNTPPRGNDSGRPWVRR